MDKIQWQLRETEINVMFWRFVMAFTYQWIMKDEVNIRTITLKNFNLYKQEIKTGPHLTVINSAPQILRCYIIPGSVDKYIRASTGMYIHVKLNAGQRPLLQPTQTPITHLFKKRKVCIHNFTKYFNIKEQHSYYHPNARCVVHLINWYFILSSFDN